MHLQDMQASRSTVGMGQAGKLLAAPQGRQADTCGKRHPAGRKERMQPTNFTGNQLGKAEAKSLLNLILITNKHYEIAVGRCTCSCLDVHVPTNPGEVWSDRCSLFIHCLYAVVYLKSTRRRTCD